MCPQGNPYMVKTQVVNTTEARTRKGRQDTVVHGEESIEDMSAEDVHSEDLDNEDWIYYELEKSCDDGFWHDTADTIVSNSGKHLSEYQQARLQRFVLTIAKRIFMFGSLINPSFTYNLKKSSHVMQVEDKYHVIVRREQNIVHIFACTAQENETFSWRADVKKSTRKDALGIQNNPSRLSSNPDQHNSARSLQHETDDEIDPDSSFVKRIQDHEERQAASRRAAEARAAADSRRGRPQEGSIGRVIHSKGPDAGRARLQSIFVHEEAGAPKVPAQQPQDSNLQPQRREGVAVAQGGAAANVSAPEVSAPAPQASNLQQQQRERVPQEEIRNQLLSRHNNGAARPREGVAAAQEGAAAKFPGQQPQVSNLQPQPREGVAAAQRVRRKDSEDDDDDN